MISISTTRRNSKNAPPSASHDPAAVRARRFVRDALPASRASITVGDVHGVGVKFEKRGGDAFAFAVLHTRDPRLVRLRTQGNCPRMEFTFKPRETREVARFVAAVMLLDQGDKFRDQGELFDGASGTASNLWTPKARDLYHSKRQGRRR